MSNIVNNWMVCTVICIHNIIFGYIFNITAHTFPLHSWGNSRKFACVLDGFHDFGHCDMFGKYKNAVLL